MSWQKKLAEGFSTASALLEFLDLPADLSAPHAEQTFKTRVPREFAARMELGNPNDPLLLQVLAQTTELEVASEYTLDPLEEKQFNPLPGLVHKYPSRVLLTLTGSCAIHCRYCFRRHFPYHENNPGRKGLASLMEYIQKDPNIREVILSGGDPLLASDATFDELLSELESIPHLSTLRIHSRVPVVLPARLTPTWLSRMKGSPLHKVMVLHTNHPQELSASVKQACDALKQHGFHLLNQAVLLKGVNDEVDTLVALSEKLFEFGVLPYYLHLLDKVQGAQHFDLPEEKALALYHELQKRCSGYLLPKLAREEPGKMHKTLLTADLDRLV